MHIRKKIRYFTLLFMISLLQMGCSLFPIEKKPDDLVVAISEKGIEYTMDVVRRGDIALNGKVNCVYAQTKEAQLSFPVSDKIISNVYVNKGDYVLAGTLLASLNIDGIDDNIANEEYEIARLSLLISQTKELMEFDKIERAEKRNREYYVTMEYNQLLAYDEATVELLNNYQLQIENYKDKLSILNLRLHADQQKKVESLVYASMNGTISFVRQNLEGSLCVSEETIITIIDDSDCAFTTDNLEYASYFNENEPVTITTGYGEKAIGYEAYPVFTDSLNGKMSFQLVEPDLQLIINTAGVIQLVLDERSNVLYINKGVLHMADEKYYVYTLDKDGVRTQQFVTVGLLGNDYAEIIDGLAEGDLVILR
ncbi:MAG TPA: hypothetical protein VJZ04_02160 [Lachnospiraceae bacterium]|nr:hypothetical protein [Lachnospiraceae bacterium]